MSKQNSPWKKAHGNAQKLPWRQDNTHTHKTICSWNPKQPTISYVKIWNHPIDSQSFLNGWLFGVPGVFVFFFGEGPFFWERLLYMLLLVLNVYAIYSFVTLAMRTEGEFFWEGFFFVQKLGSQGDCWWTKSCTRWSAQESPGWPNELPRLVDLGKSWMKWDHRKKGQPRLVWSTGSQYL